MNDIDQMPVIVLSLTLIRAHTICPTVMLATSRTVKVKGRIKIEIVSINTNNGDRAKGAPDGDKWAVISTGIILNWETRTVDQNNNPMTAANQIVEVIGKVKGVIPSKFNVIKEIKILRNHPLLSEIDSLFIINPNFLINVRDIGLEGISKINKGRIQNRSFPWSTPEKISVNINSSKE